MNDFCRRVRLQARARDTIVCCGLDPDIARLPAEFTGRFLPERAIVEFLKKFIDITVEHVCAYKIQKAFFDHYSGAQAMLSEVIAHIQAASDCTPVILDCKIGDISNTMDVYLKTYFDVLKVDAVVINPYMGPEVWLAFRKYPEKTAAVLVRTSSPQSGVLQDALLDNGCTVWRRVLDLIVAEWRSGGAVMPILADDNQGMLAGLRLSIPDEMPVLLAGVGSQGGTGAAVRHLTDSEGLGVLVNSSRALLYPYEPNERDWGHAVENAVVQFKILLNGFRG